MTTSQPPPGRWPRCCLHELPHGMATMAPPLSSSQLKAPRGTRSSSMGAQPPHFLLLLLLPGTLLLPSRSHSSPDP